MDLIPSHAVSVRGRQQSRWHNFTPPDQGVSVRGQLPGEEIHEFKEDEERRKNLFYVYSFQNQIYFWNIHQLNNKYFLKKKKI